MTTGKSDPSFQAATSNWNIKIVVSYRQLWSWLPSSKNQHEKGEGSRTRWSHLPKSTDPLPWLLDHTRPTPSVEYYKAMTSPENRKKIRVTMKPNAVGFGVKLPYTDAVLQAYEDFGDQRTILNIHEDMDVVSNFVCNALDGATSACEASFHREEGRSNPSVDMSYDLLAHEAADRGIIDATKWKKRSFLVEEIQKYHKKELGLSPLPMECMDQKDLEALLKESLRMEQILVPEFAANTTHVEQHKQMFWSAVAKNKFCSLDVNAALKDPTWLKFFEQMQEEEIKN